MYGKVYFLKFFFVFFEDGRNLCHGFCRYLYQVFPININRTKVSESQTLCWSLIRVPPPYFWRLISIKLKLQKTWVSMMSIFSKRAKKGKTPARFVKIHVQCIVYFNFKTLHDFHHFLLKNLSHEKKKVHQNSYPVNNLR